MLNNFLNGYIHVDAFAVIMIALVLYISLSVASFGSRYMKGDIKYGSFFFNLTMLVVGVSVMAISDNLCLLLLSYLFSNMILVRLMIHKSSWKAARAAGLMAAKNYTLSLIFLASAFVLFYFSTGESSVSKIIHHDAHSVLMVLALVFVLLAAMAQSAIWPFHRWLLSSLNSPTPVSAIMHAGLINGGGFLLVRFSPLYLHHSFLLTSIFLIGLASALVGTLWKLMQSDVKRMLACSTMGQMGFMLVQCGLGLFPAAVAHLVWHGMFKAHSFLASGGAAREKRLDLSYPPKKRILIWAFVCGLAGSFAFAFASGKSWLRGDTTLVLMVVAFLGGSQLALPLLRANGVSKLPLGVIANVVAGIVYGYSIHFITWVMAPMGIMQPQPLNGFHILGIISLIVTWLSILFIGHESKKSSENVWMLKGYVKALNASQPYPSTVTAHRNSYQYK